MIWKKILGLFGKESPSEPVKEIKSNNLKGNDPINGEYKTGFVEFINRSKRYGFIKSDETSQDVYVNFADTIDKIYPGDKVKFLVITNDKGLRAKEVVVI